MLPTLFDVSAELRDGFIERHQHIDDTYLSALSDDRQASTSASRSPEAVRVASIPHALVETWARQGFDIYREDARAIVARLRRENLHAFLATDRNV